MNKEITYNKIKINYNYIIYPDNQLHIIYKINDIINDFWVDIDNFDILDNYKKFTKDELEEKIEIILLMYFQDFENNLLEILKGDRNE